MTRRFWPSVLQVGALLLTLVLIGTWLALLRPTALGGSTSYVFVDGESMAPELSWGDLAIVRKGSYDVGDVVAFRLSEDEGGAFVIHRIVGGNETAGFLTQGDNADELDFWQPTVDEIVGKLWLNVPGGADWLRVVSAPLPLAALMGILALTMVSGETVKRRRRGGRRVEQKTNSNASEEVKRRRRGGRRVQQKTKRYASAEGRLPVDAKWLIWAGTLGLLTLALTAIAVYAFVQSTQKAVFDERLQVEHTVAFDYTVQSEPSTLDPDGVIGPISASAPAAENERNSSPIFTKLAKSMDIGVEYAALGVEPDGLRGQLSAELEIRAEDGWVRTRDLLAPTSFTGSEAEARMQIDLNEIASFVTTVQGETGFFADSYTVSVMLTVQLEGTVGSEPIQDTYTAAFPIDFDDETITPGEQLAFTEVSEIGETVTKTNTMSELGIPVPVQVVRWLSLVGALLALGGTVAVVALAYRRLSQDEVAMIRARYGSMLVSVAEVNRSTSRRIRVASMQDLARVAQRDGRMILDQRNGAGTHRYFVDDGSVTYEYTASSPPQEERQPEEMEIQTS